MNIENRELSQKLVDTIEFLKQSISEISVYDLNYYSMTELYYNIAKKINELIETYHEFGVTISEEVIKQNECLQYLLNDGLIKEVVNKINQMVADGTMDTIINHNIFNDLNSQIKDIVYNIKDYGAKNDGSEDISSILQNLIDSIPDGSKIQFENGEYLLNNNVSFNSKIIDFVVSPLTEFIGDGKIEPFTTNSNHMRTGTSFTRKPNLGRTDGNYNNYGDSSLNLEMLPQDGYKGNAVGLFISAKTNNSVKESEIWGQNIVTTVSEPYVGNCWGLEIDLNTHSEGANGIGVDVTSTGLVNGFAGYIARRANDSKWKYGYLAQKCNIGYAVSSSDIGFYLNDCSTGFKAEIDKDHIILKKTSNTNDADNILVYLDDNDNEIFSVKADGTLRSKQAIFNNYVSTNTLGVTKKITMPSSNENTTTIIKYVYDRVLVNNITVPANNSIDHTISFIGTEIGDLINISPSSVLPNGIFVQGYAINTDQMRIRFSNCTNQDVTISSSQFEITSTKHSNS